MFRLMKKEHQFICRAKSETFGISELVAIHMARVKLPLSELSRISIIRTK